MITKHPIHFQKATLAHKGTVFEWLSHPHVREFWDNSPEHKQDIEIFMEGRQRPSPYFNGIFTYWVGLIVTTPYALIMTSDVFPEPSLPAEWLPHLSKTGKTSSIDFMIGNVDFFGKGFAAPTLQAFTEFIPAEVDLTVDTFIIDPSQRNPRAIHVYEKAGFHSVANFVRNNEPHLLMVKRKGSGND